MTTDKEEHTRLPKQGVIVPLDVRCGQCYHFAKQRAERYADVCSKLGILKIGRPCSSFLADVNSLTLATDEGATFAQILDKIPSTKLATYAALINQERTTRRCGFRHGQLVYVRVYPDEYVSNYAQAWILLAQKKQVIVQGVRGFRGSFMRTSILTEIEFAAKKKALIARKRLTDPNLKKHTTWRPKNLSKAVRDYIPPTIDDLNIAPVKKKPPTADKSGIINIRGGERDD